MQSSIRCSHSFSVHTRTHTRTLTHTRTHAGIWLDWDGDSYLSVSALPRYRDLLCGLCGNYNGFPRDDLIGADGYFKSTVASFAETWKVAGSKCTRRDYDKKWVQSLAR